MPNHKLLYKMLLMAIPVLGLSIATAQADTPKVFKPSTEPVFSTPRAKPNIHMVLDDSASMKGNGSWDVTLNGQTVERRTALDYAYKALLNKYKDKAYIGVSFLWQAYDLKNGYYPNQGSGLVRLPIADYSKKTLSQIENEYGISRLIQNSPGNTPMYPGIYEAIKMFRGQPITANGVNGTFTQFPKVALVSSKINKETKQYYQYVEHKSPVRFRCQQNHMIVMTDGVPNDTRVWGIDTKDGLNMYSPVTSNRQLIDGDVNLSAYADISTAFIDKNPGEKNNHINILGRLTADMDLRQYQSGTDEAGKPWINDLFSMPMPIYMHTVSLGVNSKAAIYTGLTSAINTKNNKDKPGLNLGFEKDGSAEDLLAAFDTIFATIIRSTSSASAVNDRTSSALIKQPPKFDGNGNVIVSSIGTVRYDTVYDFRSYIGSIRARTSYIDPKTNLSDKIELWSTDDRLKVNQGRYVTLSDTTPGITLVELKAESKNVGYLQFKKIDSKFTTNNMDWLTNFKKNTNLDGLRERLYPLGSITSPDVVLANKDILNIDVAKDKMSENLKSSLTKWWLYKAKHQLNNLIIVGDNDGMISFIKAQRGLAAGHQAGERDTAYFPQMLVHRFDEIAKAGRNSTLVMEGRTNLVDAKVYQPTSEHSGDHIYATIGLTSQGGGGKGLVGYRIYAEKENTVDAWSKDTVNKIDPKNIYTTVTPLFEITNEGPNKTAGFKNLGYTYSGFEFFNRIVERNNSFGGSTHGKGQAVAIFGNGFGASKDKNGNQPSILYFIDAYTGEKLHEIVLDPNGMGASTPSILVSPDGIDGGQKLDRIYVGDYSGTLYKVEFNDHDFSSGSAKITALFRAPETNFGQSAISVKPLVVRAKNSNLYRVFFGTGLAASHEFDRYDNSKVQHSIYGITDHRRSKEGTFALGSSNSTLAPLLTIQDLKKGEVQYKNGHKPKKEDYESIGEYELNTITPYSDPNDKNSDKDGWHITLTADGNNSGERIIKDPQYDAHNDAVVFFTWGIEERFSKYDEEMKGDPCLADFIFGKTLSFSASSGSVSDGLKGFANKGKTGKAEGGLTGEWFESAPDGNNTTSLNDVSQSIFDDLVDMVGEENSAVVDDPNFRKIGKDVSIDGGDTTIRIESSGTDGGNSSSGDFDISDGKPKGNKPIRLSIQTLFNS